MPLIKGSSVWPEDQLGADGNSLYPVVSMRGKLATLKVNFAQTEDFVFKTPLINPEYDNPAINIVMDKSLLKIVASELPIGHTQAILESLKSFV